MMVIEHAGAMTMKWDALSKEELVRLGQNLLLLGDRHIAAATVCRPSFYRHGALLTVSAGLMMQSFIAAGEGPLDEMQFIRQDGTAYQIHAGNKAAGIDIRTAEDAADYLRFFCSLMLTDQGLAFNIMDPDRGPYRLEDGRSVNAPRLAVFEDGEEGCFGATAGVEHGRGLFMADFTIQADGLVEMIDDYPLAEAGALVQTGAIS